MRVGLKSAIVLALPITMLLLGVMLIAFDPAGLATQIRNIQLASYRHFYDGPVVIIGNLYGEVLFVVVAGMAIAILALRAHLFGAAVLTAAAIVAAQSFTWRLFMHSHVLFDSLTPSLVLAGCLAMGLATHSFEIARLRARLRYAFAGMLPPSALARIARRPDLVTLDGECRAVTCLACGIRGFVFPVEPMSDDPAGVTHRMDAVMTPLVDTALAHGAMVVRRASGGFHAYWNVPLDDPDHATHACDAASRMTAVLAEVNEQFAHERRSDDTAHKPVEIGIGIATGPVVAGGIDPHRRLTYFVMGECTLLAERILAQSEQYDRAIVVADETRKAAARAFAFLKVDVLAYGIRDAPVGLFAMLGNPRMRASPKFRALTAFHAHIFESLRMRQWQRTRKLVAQCRQLSGASQALYDLYLERIRYFETHPPAADWNGAFRPICK